MNKNKRTIKIILSFFISLIFLSNFVFGQEIPPQNISGFSYIKDVTLQINHTYINFENLSTINFQAGQHVPVDLVFKANKTLKNVDIKLRIEGAQEAIGNRVSMYIFEDFGYFHADLHFTVPNTTETGDYIMKFEVRPKGEDIEKINIPVHIEGVTPLNITIITPLYKSIIHSNSLNLVLVTDLDCICNYTLRNSSDIITSERLMENTGNKSHSQRIDNLTLTSDYPINEFYLLDISCTDKNGNINNFRETLFYVKPISPPNIILLYPEEDYSSYPKLLSFDYKVESNGTGIGSCSLILDDKEMLVKSEIELVGENSFEKRLSEGDYSWKIKCIDSFGNEGYSKNRYLTIKRSRSEGSNDYESYSHNILEDTKSPSINSQKIIEDSPEVYLYSIESNKEVKIVPSTLNSDKNIHIDSLKILLIISFGLLILILVLFILVLFFLKR